MLTTPPATPAPIGRPRPDEPFAMIERLEGRRLLAAAPPAFTQTNLVSDGAVAAQRTDAHLTNAWGLVITKPGEVWVADNGGGVATVYDTTGAPVSPSSPIVVTIPTPAGVTTPATATGVAFNAGKAFAVGAGGTAGVSAPSIYLFATEDGTISGWNPSVDATHAILAVDHSAEGAVYKGLAVTGKGKRARLYATNFHAGTIEVYDSSFNPVNIPGGFADPNLPAGFAPFNVQAIGGKLYVTYAKQDDQAVGDVRGPGNGFVDVFDARGRLKQRLASGGNLNSPWGVAKVSRRQFGGDILVGNFGDGAINVFSSKGAAVGQLHGTNGQPLIIDGLWGLATGFGKEKNTLFFTAGPNGEADGLFGKLTAQAASPANSGGGSTTPTPTPAPTPTPYPYPYP